MEGYIIFSGLVWCIAWGIVVELVIRNKGYKESWFWWGFFFGIFALIVALTKPSVNPMKVEVGPTSQNNKPPKKAEILSSGYFPDRVDIFSAVHIASWEIQKENNGDLVLSVFFLNMSESIISAVMFLGTGYNSFGDKVHVDETETFDVLGQDLSIKPREYGIVQIVLPNPDIRKVDFRVKKVCFFDGRIVENSTSKWIDLKQNPLPGKYLDFVKQYNPQGEYYSIMSEDYWQCICGFVNVGDSCKVCGMKKVVASDYSQDNIEETYQTHLEIEKERRIKADKLAEEETIKEKKAKKARIKKGIIVGCLVIIGAIGTCIFNYVAKEIRYNEERNLIAQHIKHEEYDSAYSIMIESDSYEKLKGEYGSLLCEKQEELDIKFKKDRREYVRFEEEMVYDEEKARGGLCYYEMDFNLYAVEKNGKRHNILDNTSSFDDNLSSSGIREFILYPIWSNGWLIVRKVEYDSENLYAIKYDVDEQKSYEVELADKNQSEHIFAKMSDGNILIIDGSGEEISRSTDIRLFDVIKGEETELSYDDLGRLYDYDIDKCIITVIK